MLANVDGPHSGSGTPYKAELCLNEIKEVCSADLCKPALIG